jgi:glycine/D-amino acid oxidase-like deaminating enzyme
MSNLSVWEKESFYSTQDVILVGGGLMGLWTAYELKKKNPYLKITILERNTIPLGASTRNAGFACFGSPTEIIHDIEQMGLDTTLEVVKMRYLGIEKIKGHFGMAQMEFDPCGGYECINKDYAHFDQLDEKLAELNEHLKDLTDQDQTFVRRDAAIAEKGMMGFDAMVENSLEGSLHSGKLVSALIQKVQAAGVSILNGMEVVYWEKKPQGIILHTSQQILFTCNQVLFCTNAYGNTLFPDLNITPARGQVIVTSPIEGLKLNGTFHFDEGFYYWRNLGNRILLGGARNADFETEQTTETAVTDLIKNKLTGFLKDHIHPSYQYTIEDHWSGIMGFTENKKPLLSQVSDNVFVAIACNGMGVALTPIMGEKAAELMLLYF